MDSRNFIYCFYLLAVVLCGCDESSDKGRNETDLKNSFKEYVEAYNKKDPHEVASYWDEDATLYNPITGAMIEGRSAIEDYYKDRFEKNPNSTLHLTVDDISFPEQDNAKIKAHFQLSGINDETPEGKIEGRLLIDAVKDDGDWYFLNFSQFEKMPITSQYEHLAPLDWLAGKWVDESEDIDIVSEWKWDKHKNFLTQRFTMKVMGEDDFDGFQMIGWDPSKEKIRSWVFDSDGGFGEGSVIHQGDSWYASMVFTLPDGRIGTSTNIYTKVNDNSYTFSSVGRDIDGTVLPNVGPYKIVRKH